MAGRIRPIGPSLLTSEPEELYALSNCNIPYSQDSRWTSEPFVSLSRRYGLALNYFKSKVKVTWERWKHTEKHDEPFKCSVWLDHSQCCTVERIEALLLGLKTPYSWISHQSFLMRRVMHQRSRLICAHSPKMSGNACFSEAVLCSFII